MPPFGIAGFQGDGKGSHAAPSLTAPRPPAAGQMAVERGGRHLQPPCHFLDGDFRIAQQCLGRRQVFGIQ